LGFATRLSFYALRKRQDRCFSRNAVVFAMALTFSNKMGIKLESRLLKTRGD
jgi:hypothetical protein